MRTTGKQMRISRALGIYNHYTTSIKFNEWTHEGALTITHAVLCVKGKTSIYFHYARLYLLLPNVWNFVDLFKHSDTIKWQTFSAMRCTQQAYCYCNWPPRKRHFPFKIAWAKVFVFICGARYPVSLFAWRILLSALDNTQTLKAWNNQHKGTRTFKDVIIMVQA